MAASSIELQNATDVRDRKTVLPALWTFATVNYIYADVLTLFDVLADPASVKKLGTGYIGSMHMTQGAMLAAAVLMETAFAMIFLSRVLSHRPNRWTNLIAALIHTLAVLASLFVGGPPTSFTYYTFFAGVEIACTLFIIWYAWTWRSPEQGWEPIAAGVDQGAT